MAQPTKYVEHLDKLINKKCQKQSQLAAALMFPLSFRFELVPK